MFKFLSPKFKIKTFFKEDLEPQEVLLDCLARKKEEEIGISEKKFETPLSGKASFLVWFFVFFSMALLFGITFYFQFFMYEKYSVLAEGNKFAVRSVQAARGVIYDVNRNQLVFNRPSYDLVFNKKDFPGDDKIIKELAKAIGKEADSLKEAMENDSLILKDIDHALLIILKSRIEEFPGFEIEETFIRDYKYGSLLSHILGYTGKITTEELALYSGHTFLDYIGKDGIERSYEEVLRRNPGKIKIERDVFGNQISKEIVSLPEPGESLLLWLDLELQQKLEESLHSNLERLGSKRAVGIAINPKTGGIMAMVNIPSYDNNIFNLPRENADEIRDLLNNSEKPLFNRAVAGQYPTGSTIKPLVAAAALEEGLITPEKQIYAGGKIEIPHRYDPSIVYTYRDLRVHGLTDMRKAIAASVNVYFYAIGGGYQDQPGLGPTRIKRYLELFSWGERTGIDLPNEQKGLIPSPEWKREAKNESWWDGDTYNLSIGQGDIFITPLQVALSFAGIANGGTLYSPRAVKSIIDSNGNEKEIEPEVIRSNFITPKNMEVIREGMRATVTGENSPHASAMSLNLLSEKVAAKTGTAQIPKKDHYHNWIAVFGPYEDPEIALVVLVEEVKGVQPATIPVAREVLEWYFNNR